MVMLGGLGASAFEPRAFGSLRFRSMAPIFEKCLVHGVKWRRRNGCANVSICYLAENDDGHARHERESPASCSGGDVATIADVAREAGVSVSTVSHVVNGTRRVAPATATAVQAVIDAIGFRPNVLARSLKTASTQSVGIAISAIANPYFSDIICAIATKSALLGMMVFLSETQDD